MIFKWFGPIALLAALVIGDQIRINRPAHKYRLAVEVETPEGSKSASGVVAVHPDRSYSRRGQTRTVGDAVFVDLGSGKNLVALLAHVDKNLVLDDVNYVALRAYNEAAGKRVSFNEMSRLTGIVPVKGALIPVLVTFADPANPGTARAVSPDDAEAVLGKGYRLQGITAEVVPNGYWPLDFGGVLGEPVTRGIQAKLPWLNGADNPARRRAPGGRLARGRGDRRQRGLYAKIAGQARGNPPDIDPPPSRRHDRLESWPNPEDPFAQDDDSGIFAMRRPVVGVIGNAHRVENRFQTQMVGERNLRAVADVAGALPLMFAGSPEITDIGALLDVVDGVVLTGARANVHPTRFKTEPHERHEPYDIHRDDVALALTEACVARGVPIFGICRGLQEMNVAFGGSLHPEIREIPGRMNHRMPRLENRAYP